LYNCGGHTLPTKGISIPNSKNQVRGRAIPVNYNVIIELAIAKINDAFMNSSYACEFDHGHSRETPVCGNIKRVWPTIKVL